MGEQCRLLGHMTWRRLGGIEDHILSSSEVRSKRRLPVTVIMDPGVANRDTRDESCVEAMQTRTTRGRERHHCWALGNHASPTRAIAITRRLAASVVLARISLCQSARWIFPSILDVMPLLLNIPLYTQPRPISVHESLCDRLGTPEQATIKSQQLGQYLGF